MENSQLSSEVHRTGSPASSNSLFDFIVSSALASVLALIAFHLSLIATSAPLSTKESVLVDGTIELLEARGFQTEAFLLRHTATFQSRDNWLNLIAEKENAFAATNFPFHIVTLYPDFYTRTSDGTERAMVLLHEAQHLLMKDEAAAYEYVWRNRTKLGWTQLTHGHTETYVIIEQQTREFAPELFNCSSNYWNDCTETIRAAK